MKLSPEQFMARVAEGRELFADPRVQRVLAAKPHPSIYRAKAGATLLNWARYVVDVNIAWAMDNPRARARSLRACRVIKYAAIQKDDADGKPGKA